MTDRRVESLTTTQLYRKRAYDRSNQRASRDKKKNRIAELEGENAQLKARLARVEDELERLRASEATLRSAICTAYSTIQQPNPKRTRDRDEISSPATSSHTPTSQKQPLQDAENEASPFQTEANNAQMPLSPLTADISTPSLDDSSPSFDDMTSFAIRDRSTGLSFGMPLGADFETGMQFWDQSFPSEFFADNAFSLSFSDPFVSDASDASYWGQTSDISPTPLHVPERTHPWERLPQHIAPTCRLDQVLLELVQCSRQRITPELTHSEPFPSVASLLNPKSNNSTNPISTAIGQHGRVTLNVPSLPLKIGMMYNMCLMVRWLISPTKRNYDAMPEFLRPTETQLSIPHPIWVDVITWPQGRDAVLQEMDWSQFETFRVLGCKYISVHWPQDPSKIFRSVSKTELRLNPAFEVHIRSLDNWTMASIVMEDFPFFQCVPSSRSVDCGEEPDIP
ncbi:hypothetical protein NA57DRAFT_78524 [Rhizodiscina lignyota]|uniref:BZIP domain-containing protein n=1 Tax=Rhizodiscina lignyota TaxID=1504668 RepID=A0A9P4I8F3_9PEZI|nr:hypothetical protein NA57DRAFT_78524 [Rhizodiscina lignyota]